jgi:hypothetical protein
VVSHISRKTSEMCGIRWSVIRTQFQSSVEAFRAKVRTVVFAGEA